MASFASSWNLRRSLVIGGAAVAVPIFLALGGVAATGLAVVTGGLIVGVAVHSVMRHDDVLGRLQKRLVDARVLPVNAEETATRVTGSWKGARTWIDVDDAHARVVVGLGMEGWPAGLTIEPRGDVQGSTTGDPTFDNVADVTAEDHLWRPLLTSDVRRALVDLFTRWEARVFEQTIELTTHTADVENALDLAARLVASIPRAHRDVNERVFDLASKDPSSAVRLGHYRWLESRDWDPPRVYRAAAADRDGDVAAWGNAQLGPDRGVFR